MKHFRIRAVLSCLCLCLACLALAQGSNTVQITSSGGYCQMNLAVGTNAVAIGVTGTWTGSTLTVSVSPDGANYTTSALPVVALVDLDTNGITSAATGLWMTSAVGKTIRVTCGTLSTGNLTVTVVTGAGQNPSAAGGSQPLPTGAATAALQNAGKSLSQIATSSANATNGLYLTGAHQIARIVGDNASNTTLYLQIFNSTTLPSNGSTPIAEVTVGFGISTSPTENEEALTPDWIPTTTGVYYAWSTTSGTLTLASSGTGLLVRIYGN